MITRRHVSALLAIVLPMVMLAGVVGAYLPVRLEIVAGVVVLVALSVAGVAARRRRSAAALARTSDRVALSVPASAPARGSVVRALGAVEARELALNPWFHAGIGFCVLFLVAIWSFERSWWDTAALLPLMLHPLCGMTVVAAHRNASRARRERAEELFDACPATSQQRAGAQLVAAAVPVAAAVVWASIVLVGTSVALDDIYGPFDDRVLVDLAIAVMLLPTGATALGVLLGRRAPFVLTPFLVVGAIALVNLELWDEPDGRGWLSTGRPSNPADGVFLEPPQLGRLAWLVGLVLLVAAFAVAAQQTTVRRTAVVAGALAATAGVALVAQPLSASDVDRLVGYSAAAPEHSVCWDLAPDVDLCAPEPYADHGRHMVEHLQPIVDARPDPASADAIAFRFVVADRRMLQRTVRDRVSMARTSDAVVLTLPFSHHESAFGVARFRLAAQVAGVSIPPGNTLLGGQARGVVVLWLAVRGLDEETAVDVLTPYDVSTPSHAGHVWPGVCGADLQWAPEDITAARALRELPEDDVLAILSDDWGRWTSRSTSTDELLAALGLPPVGPASPIATLGEPCE